MTNSSIAPAEFKAFRDFLESNSGIVLSDNKTYLVTSRLTRLMDELCIQGFGDLMQKLNTDARLRKLILDAMTTNETSWFRDSYPYDILREQLLPEFVRNRVPRIKLWSAACSTGQEPYSISMIVAEYLAANPGVFSTDKIDITATDLSGRVLEQAKKGIYDDSGLSRGLSAERKQRFFKQQDKHQEKTQLNHWHINEDIKRRISFRELNLMQSYSLLGKFDIIFCRNVLIYFSPELKKDIISRMVQALNKDGYLILGGSESISGYSEAFELVRWKAGVVYRLKKS